MKGVWRRSGLAAFFGSHRHILMTFFVLSRCESSNMKRCSIPIWKHLTLTFICSSLPACLLPCCIPIKVSQIYFVTSALWVFHWFSVWKKTVMRDVHITDRSYGFVVVEFRSHHHCSLWECRPCRLTNKSNNHLVQKVVKPRR